MNTAKYEGTWSTRNEIFCGRSGGQRQNDARWSNYCHCHRRSWSQGFRISQWIIFGFWIDARRNLWEIVMCVAGEAAAGNVFASNIFRCESRGRRVVQGSRSSISGALRSVMGNPHEGVRVVCWFNSSRRCWWSETRSNRMDEGEIDNGPCDPLVLGPLLLLSTASLHDTGANWCIACCVVSEVLTTASRQRGGNYAENGRGREARLFHALWRDVTSYGAETHVNYGTTTATSEHVGDTSTS